MTRPRRSGRDRLRLDQREDLLQRLRQPEHQLHGGGRLPEDGGCARDPPSRHHARPLQRVSPSHRHQYTTVYRLLG